MKIISACILLCVVACANAAAGSEPKAQRPAYKAAPAPLVAVGPAKPYSYAYEVVDPTQSGNAYGHR